MNVKMPKVEGLSWKHCIHAPKSKSVWVLRARLLSDLATEYVTSLYYEYTKFKNQVDN